MDWKKIIKRRKKPARKFETWHLGGRAVWTPRNYQKLSEEGYQKNVIVYRH